MPPTPPRRRPSEVSAGAVVARHTETGWEYVLVRQVSGGWGLPKGHLEAGETPEAAALREIAEETGLPLETLTIRSAIAPSEYVYRNKQGRLVFKYLHQYLVITTWAGELTRQEAEIDEAGWFPLPEALKQASFPATREALREGAALLGDGGASQGAA